MLSSESFCPAVLGGSMCVWVCVCETLRMLFGCFQGFVDALLVFVFLSALTAQPTVSALVTLKSRHTHLFSWMLTVTVRRCQWRRHSNTLLLHRTHSKFTLNITRVSGYPTKLSLSHEKHICMLAGWVTEQTLVWCVWGFAVVRLQTADVCFELHSDEVSSCSPL